MSGSMRDVNLHLVRTMEDAWEMKRWLGERRSVLAVDTETGGLEFWKQPLRLVQFGDAMNGWAVPWDDWKGLCKEVLTTYDGDMAMHNAPFDGNFLEVHGKIKLPWHQIHDTRTQAHLLDPARPTGLKPLGARFVDGKAAAGQAMLDDGMAKHKWTWATVPIDFEPYWVYAALDTVITARLDEQFRPQVNASFSRVYELELASQRVLMEMHRRGARIDIKYTEEKLAELIAYVEQCRKYVEQTYGVSISSPSKVGDRLLELGAPLSERTNGGQWKLDKEILQGIIGLDDRDQRIREPQGTQVEELAGLVYAARKTQKICSTYLENFLSMHDNGFLHPSINPLGARTGRMSVTLPALQTLPRGRVVRDCIIPSHDDDVLISTDYDQVELRLITHFSEDPGLVAAFKSGDDFFNVIAREIYADPSIKKGDPRRQLTKNCMYAKGYGAGIAKMAATAKVSYEQMKAVADGLDIKFPGMRGLQRKVEDVAMRRLHDEGEAYVVDPFGRRQPAEADKVYGLVNSLVQGTAASITKQAIVNADMMGLGDYLILPVHDELILSVPKDRVEDARPVIKEAMENVGEWLVPLTAGVDVMTERWGEKYA